MSGYHVKRVLFHALMRVVTFSKEVISSGLFVTSPTVSKDW